jgi:hypothetical protein
MKEHQTQQCLSSILHPLKKIMTHQANLSQNIQLLIPLLQIATTQGIDMKMIQNNVML